jgi:hypothetical protein
MPQQANFDTCMQSLEEIKNLLAEMNKYRFAEQFLNNEEFCSLFKISNKTAQLWRESGQIPFARLGKKIFYRLSDIESLFEQQFAKPQRRLPKKKNLRRKRLKTDPQSNGWTIKV